MKAVFVILVAAALLFAGCASTQAPPPPPSGNNQTPPPPKENETGGVGIPNPASKFCADAGYQSEFRDGTGGEIGYCIFKNGRECEEWAFYRGECTDADSFTMAESPGFVIEPKEVTYRFSADGTLKITEVQLRNGTATTLVAWLAPADFASFIKTLNSYGYRSLDATYASCGGNYGCPTDMPSITLSLRTQGVEQQVYLYGVADHPEALDKSILEFKGLIEDNTFVRLNVSGCKLMRDLETRTLQCFGSVSGITNPKLTAPPAGFEPVANDGSLGGCTVDGEGACAYQPPAQVSEQLCTSSGGNWNGCGSACRGAPEGTACTLQCVSYCECGGIVGFACPSAFFCTDYLPKDAADAMGICKPAG